MGDGFWDRLAARVRPTETLKTVENPRTIVRAFTTIMVNGVLQVSLGVGLFLWFHERAAAVAQVALAMSFVVGWLCFAVTGGLFAAMAIVVGAGTALTIIGHVLLGGYAYSGGYLLFGVALTVGTAVVLGRRSAIVVGGAFSTAGIAFGFLETTLQANRLPPDPILTKILFASTLVGSIGIVVPLVLYFAERLNAERERAEQLLLNVLPAQVALELKEQGHVAARRFDSISVLFADISGFTPMSAAMAPEELVDQLNEVFTFFDDLAERYGVEKIRTIGDAYMVAAGVPEPRDDHASVLARMALDITSYAASTSLRFRVGIHSGPAVAGVIGTKKFQYDVWGDTVNTASRMESHGEPGRIQVSEATHRLIDDEFVATRRGPVDVKGLGVLETWWLESRRDPVVAGG